MDLAQSLVCSKHLINAGQFYHHYASLESQRRVPREGVWSRVPSFSDLPEGVPDLNHLTGYFAYRSFKIN